ncbi:hypothetical protein PGC35_02140 [Psychrobacillus sp. PGGUH221]|uniref:hypothetical protein n=1 Tax=Psychrobacillus sp. PGGUH221 TaxID=3020058 RepID=UPI0035C71AE4
MTKANVTKVLRVPGTRNKEKHRKTMKKKRRKKEKQRRKKEETNLENKQKILWKYKFEITDVEF